jgi:hypothetical protein
MENLMNLKLFFKTECSFKTICVGPEWSELIYE